MSLPYWDREVELVYECRLHIFFPTAEDCSSPVEWFSLGDEMEMAPHPDEFGDAQNSDEMYVRQREQSGQPDTVGGRRGGVQRQGRVVARHAVGN